MEEDWRGANAGDVWLLRVVVAFVLWVWSWWLSAWVGFWFCLLVVVVVVVVVVVAVVAVVAVAVAAVAGAVLNLTRRRELAHGLQARLHA